MARWWPLMAADRPLMTTDDDCWRPVTFQGEAGVLETTPDEHVSATLNTALMGAAFHWASGASFEVRSPLIALDCA